MTRVPEGGVLAASIVLLLLAGCAGSPDQPAEADAMGTLLEGQAAKTLVYECDDFEFVVSQGDEQVVVHTEDDYRVLPQVRAASGARYEDGHMLFWSKGSEASLEVGERRYSGCQLNPARAPWEEARRRGVSFRALGQEPGWVLEIQPERYMLLDADYGGLRVLMPTPEPELTDGGERYTSVTEAHEMQVDIVLETCADTMSGAVYRNRVTVNLDGRVFRGCGDALEPL